MKASSIYEKTYSSLVKMISAGENYFTQNICNKWMRYIETFHLKKKKSNLGLSTIYLLDGNYKFRINYKNAFLYDIRTLNIGLSAVVTLVFIYMVEREIY